MPALLDVKCLAANAAGRQRQTAFQGCQAASEISSKGVLAMGLVFTNVSCILATCVWPHLCTWYGTWSNQGGDIRERAGIQTDFGEGGCFIEKESSRVSWLQTACICSRSASKTWKLICNLRYHISCNVICPFLGPIILGFWILVHLSLFYIMPKVVLWKSIVQAPNLYYHGAGLCAPPFG